MAAIQASRMGKDVVMVARDGHVGGLVTSGLTATDMNKHAAIGGLAAEFYGRIYAYYESPEAWRNQSRDDFMQSTLKRTFTGKNDGRRIQWVYESGVAEKILKEMLSESGVVVLEGVQIAQAAGVKMRKSKIRSISLTDGRKIRSDEFIDCSYTGDLMAAAGVGYTVGRESREQYGESLAGIRIDMETDLFGDTDPYNPKTGLPWPYVDAEPWGEQGDGDSRVQSYCYRVTLTDDPDNMVPVTRPEGYNPDLYEVLLGQILHNPGIELKNIITFTPMPNRKTDTNHLDFFGAAHSYPEADYAERSEIEALHRNYAQGMLWFLGNDERVPESLRTEMRRWGYAADEFTDTGNFPNHMYVREARRMVGDYVMTQKNIVRDGREPAPDPVGIGTYALDCHFVSTVIVDGKLHREGTLQMKLPVTPYPISYRSLTPKRAECTNLLVPVCLSASHVAYGSIRMEPQYMVLGQSAAIAACLCIDGSCAVQDLPYDTLHEYLEKYNQITEY